MFIDLIAMHNRSLKYQLLGWTLFAAATLLWSPYLGKCPSGNLFWVLGFLAWAVTITGAVFVTIILIARYFLSRDRNQLLFVVTANLWMTVIGMFLTSIVWGYAGVEFCA